MDRSARRLGLVGIASMPWVGLIGALAAGSGWWAGLFLAHCAAFSFLAWWCWPKGGGR